MKETPLETSFREMMEKEYGVRFVDCTPETGIPATEQKQRVSSVPEIPVSPTDN